MSTTLVTLSPAAVKALARRWFLAGFRCSGHKAHGETRLRNSQAFEGLLDAEFERAWTDQNRPLTATISPKLAAAPPARPRKKLR